VVSGSPKKYSPERAVGELSCRRQTPMSGHAIHIKIDGRTYSGVFNVDRKTLTVKTSYGSKSAEITPRVTHETLAHQLLQELVQQEKSRKGSLL
jgi:hypothetical protein